MKSFIALLSLTIAWGSSALAASPSNEVPLNIDTWQQQRGRGLADFASITPYFMGVNATDVYKIDHQKRDYELHEIESVARLIDHPAVAAIVVMNKDGDVMLEHYRGSDRNSTFSDQSSTKSIGYVLLNRALKAGQIKMDESVETYLPYIGTGFKGRTVSDVASMAVNHNIAELLAYTGDPEALIMFDNDERVIGFQRNEERETLREFVAKITPAGDSNEWTGDIANYATVNTNVLMLILESAAKEPADVMVRNLFEEVGGENSVYMGTDVEGVPILGASMVSSTVDFARFGRLLIADTETAQDDIKNSKKKGEVVPADLTAIESRYYKSAIMNKYGLGHSGWGGQLIWTDPETGTIVAINSLVSSDLPAPYDHFHKLYTAAYDIVKHYRKK